MDSTNSAFFKSKVLGHPAGLFVLFFTEMWERFSYYGMRALLVIFLVSAFGMGGWDWPREDALALYGTYTALVYLTPILGGMLADRVIGYRRAVFYGATVMTLGHACMAIEFSHIFLYIGIGLLIIGNGLFKPNMTSTISEMYKDTPEKKDGAYVIFYMGVNAGAFLGIMMCGYLGEMVGWSWGFGLAGIFMFMGMLQFYFAQDIFGDIGKKPVKQEKSAVVKNEKDDVPLNPFSLLDKIMIVVIAVVGLTWIINDPMSKIADLNILAFGGVDYSNYFIAGALILFFTVLALRILRYDKVLRGRMIAIVFFAFFIIFFWGSFEQAGGSMTIFAKDYTQRVFSGSAANIFIVVDILITVIPVAIITWVLVLLFRQTFAKYATSNIILGLSFVIIWGIVGWKINRNLNTFSYDITYPALVSVQTGDDGKEKTSYTALTGMMDVAPDAVIEQRPTTIRSAENLRAGDKTYILDIDKRGTYRELSADKIVVVDRKIEATVIKKRENEVEIPATWFLILNSLFIIAFAPLFSRWWESRYNPPPAVKYGLGLILLGVGFAVLAFGSMTIPQGAKAASVSIVWLVLAYLFHTLGELCLSPVSLSYISKLVPARMIAFMFGVWYLAIAIGNKLAGVMGGQIDKITEQWDLTTFFLIFTLIPVGMGLVAVLISPFIKKLMHGVK